MGFSFGAVSRDAKKFGLILGDSTKKDFRVLWSDGLVEDQDLRTAKKCLLNSPTFHFNLKSDRNLKLFESSPELLVSEILAESRHLNSKKASMTSVEIKKALREIGVPEEIISKHWKPLRKSLLKEDSGVKVSEDTFRLISKDFQFSNPVNVDWDDLLNKLAGISAASPVEVEPNSASAQAYEVKATEERVNAGEAIHGKASLWTKFAEAIEGGSEFSAIRLESIECLDNLLEIENSFNALPVAQQNELQTKGLSSQQISVLFPILWLTRKKIDPKKATSRVIRSSILQLLKAASQSFESLGTNRQVALARLVQISSEGLVAFALQAGMIDVVAPALLALTAPELESVKTDLVAAIAKDVGKAGISDGSRSFLSQVLSLVSWASPLRRPLAEALVQKNSPALEYEIFWKGLTFEDLLWLSTLPAWGRVSSKSKPRALLCAETRTILRSAKPPAALAMLPSISIFASLVDSEDLLALVKKSFSSNEALKSAMSAIADSDSLAKAQREILEKTLLVQKASLELEASRLRNVELEQQISYLNETLTAAAQERIALSEGAKAQVQIQSAQTIAKILSSLDIENASKYQGREKAIAAAEKMGINEISFAGAEVAYDFDLHDDPEGQAKPGQKVNVLLAGYNFSRGAESIVLRKALVTL